ncbi:hypothetical protein [Zoogloea sp.]|jgi:hypothetical protein|uniref:hypothetical protein n=1 Tax=Zoogloea sp. TaxID=49181 RepID=UPI0035AF7D3C
MVIFMDMESGERGYLEPEASAGPAYDDEVLNANLLPPELALGLQEIPAAEHGQHAVPTDVDAFLSAVYRFQE